MHQFLVDHVYKHSFPRFFPISSVSNMIRQRLYVSKAVETPLLSIAMTSQIGAFGS